ncbi:MAG: S41 family peptidase [Pyrinomonadaceae bacterium]|nr:S41 family peptidase [Pyrinomonadaceae bacterium]
MKFCSITLTLLLLGLSATMPIVGQSQTASGYDRDRGRDMLNTVKDDLKRHYYDPGFHGMDVEERFKQAEAKIEQAVSNSQIFGIIAQVLAELKDSHTFFVPPRRVTRTDYGWQMQMFGDRCYVIAVKAESDADKKGLQPGDEILSIDGRKPTRENLWVLQYLYYTLRPQPGMKVTIAKHSGGTVTLDLLAKQKERKRQKDLTDGFDIFNIIRERENEDHFSRQRFVELDDLFIWKMPNFDFDRLQVDQIVDKVGKRKNLILDLRGNGGGYVDTLLRLLGNLFDRDIRVGELKKRKESEPIIAKRRGGKFFSGNLVVLVDSRSGSASEILARVVQLEKRGTVIGDQTAGAVMRSRNQRHETGVDIVSYYGVSITDADIIMQDGKSLEREGVTPDQVVLMTAADLRNSRDPVLTQAAANLGFKIEPDKAASFFPLEWRTQ